MKKATGSFEIQSTKEPPYDQTDGITLGRASFLKQFSGDLSASSRVEMTSAVTSQKGSAAYVAIERIAGTLDGKSGAFVTTHLGTMDRGSATLVITIVPDSGTGELAGIYGTMGIAIVDAKHFYTIEYEFKGAP